MSRPYETPQGERRRLSWEHLGRNSLPRASNWVSRRDGHPFGFIVKGRGSREAPAIRPAQTHTQTDKKKTDTHTQAHTQTHKGLVDVECRAA